MAQFVDVGVQVGCKGRPEVFVRPEPNARQGKGEVFRTRTMKLSKVLEMFGDKEVTVRERQCNSFNWITYDLLSVNLRSGDLPYEGIFTKLIDAGDTKKIQEAVTNLIKLYKIGIKKGD